MIFMFKESLSKGKNSFLDYHYVHSQILHILMTKPIINQIEILPLAEL